VPVDRRVRVLRDLPLRVGDPFNRQLLGVLGDTLSIRLRDMGFPTASVFLAGRQVDSARRVAEVDLEVRTGRPAVFGDVTVDGMSGEDSTFAIRLLAARRGRQYRVSDILRSQRNLASSELYRFASVEIDTARFMPSDTSRFASGVDSVPLIVRVVPAARYRVAASTGYGTDDCFRATGGYTIRNALGRGRVVEFAGRLSKIGVGDPLAWGLDEGFPCSRLTSDSIGSRQLNYLASVSLRRPAFLSPSNTLGLQAFAERRSEFAVYLREEYGGSVSLTRETGRRIPVTIGYRLAYGATTASDVSFCAFFNACTPADIGVLQERQRQGVASVGVTRLRVNNLLDPSRGTSLGFQVAHSASYTWSEPLQRFSRAVGDGAVYYPLSGGMVAAFRLRAGALVAPDNSSTTATRYVPPEQRFYAGGPNDIRGYDRNELGPVVYVILDQRLTDGEEDEIPAEAVSVSAVGGNRIVIANAELRMPSPVFASRMRLAAFVDAGSVWEVSDREERAEPFRLRLTPGAGLRFATPLGPARFDVAYRGYAYPAGPLYAAKEDGSLELLQSDYVRPRSRGLTFHFAIGQAF
jgi:outer membrane protein insertion porin family